MNIYMSCAHPYSVSVAYHFITFPDERDLHNRMFECGFDQPRSRLNANLGWPEADRILDTPRPMGEGQGDQTKQHIVKTHMIIHTLICLAFYTGRHKRYIYIYTHETRMYGCTRA